MPIAETEVINDDQLRRLHELAKALKDWKVEWLVRWLPSMGRRAPARPRTIDVKRRMRLFEPIAVAVLQ